ncbi:MAG: tetratricopeptide repeat protein, partial [Marinobacterium sp.]
RLGRYVEASELFSGLLDMRDQHWMRLGLGVAAYRQGDFERAQQNLNGVINQNQVNLDAFNWLARLYRLKGDWGQSLSLLRKSVMLQPSVAVQQGELGNVAARMKDWRLAVDAFRLAVRYGRYSAFQNPDYYFALARCLCDRMEEQQQDQARDSEREALLVLEQAVNDFQQEPVALFKSRLLQCDILWRGDKSDRAEQAAKDTLGLFQALPLGEQVLWLDPLSDGLERSNVAGSVEQLKQELTRKMVGIDWARANLTGMMQFRKGAVPEARDAFLQAHSAQPDNPSVGLNLVQAELELLRRRQADDPATSLRRCDDILYGIQYAALSPRQQQRHHKLSDRLAEQLHTQNN